MIKLIIICTKAIIIALMALLFTSCNQKFHFGNGIDGNGIVKTENRATTATFTKIESSRGLDVIIEQSIESSIQVMADENLLKHIITKVENGTLIVTTDRDMDDYSARKITIKMPIIESLSTDSGSTITTINTIKGINLKLHSDSGSELTAKAEYESISADCDSGSSQKLAGKSLKLNAHSDSGSDLDAKNLLSNDVIATSDSGSSISVQPLVSLDANADSGASIDYIGEPKKVKKTEDSGGSVSKL